MARAKYVPHNWNAGELILESNMDHMESGVAIADSDAADAVNAIAPQYSDLTFPISAYTQTCWYNNKLYVNKINIASSEEWNSSHWEEISIGSKITQLNNHFPVIGKFVVGTNTSATEENAVAEGEDTVASGLSSHAEGYGSEASGDYSHSEGGAIASGGYSHAEGSASEASGENAHVEGYETTASGDNSHSEGWGATASGMNAHAEGVDTVASGNQSHSEGEGTIANHAAQSVSGTYNVADPSEAAATAKGNYVEIVGNGTDDDARSNARTLDWYGNETLAGDLVVNKNALNEVSVSNLKTGLEDIAKYSYRFEGASDSTNTYDGITIANTGRKYTLSGTASTTGTVFISILDGTSIYNSSDWTNANTISLKQGHTYQLSLIVGNWPKANNIDVIDGLQINMFKEGSGATLVDAYPGHGKNGDIYGVYGQYYCDSDINVRFRLALTKSKFINGETVYLNYNNVKFIVGFADVTSCETISTIITTTGNKAPINYATFSNITIDNTLTLGTRYISASDAGDALYNILSLGQLTLRNAAAETVTVTIQQLKDLLELLN